MIPLLYASYGSAQAAIDTATVLLRSSVEISEEMAQRLLISYSHDVTIKDALQKFIEACRYNCTGNLNWRSVPKKLPRHDICLFMEFTSLCSGRYGFGVESLHGGVDVTL